MAEYLIKGESLVAIADEVRELSGKTEAMGVNAMADTLHTENSNFNTNLTAQDNLITQIQTALANKAQVSPVLQAKSVTPSAVQQIVTADDSYDGLSKVTVAGDSNLVPENIMSGISIFGVEGSATGGGGTELEFVTITYNSLPAPGMTVYYLDESLTLQSCAPIKGYSFSALKNSILIVIDGMEPGFPSCTYIAGLSTIAAYQVTG